MLIDQVRIHLQAGAGGSGILSFRREKYVPKGGPDGGDGGSGGSVFLQVDPSINTLLAFRYKKHFKAKSGQSGQGSNKTGRSGDDLYIPVPPGTLVKEANSSEKLADLLDPEQLFLAIKGGRGGRGNARFATSTNRAPRKFELGKPGEEITLDLELKLLADVGLVGLPNAGKSTLLSRLSNARPKIADYPFTTLEPLLGIVAVDDYRGFVMADLPGIIAGAHQGKGLGTRFLKHIERTKVLLVLIDSTSPNPVQDVEILERELRSYDAELLQRPRLVVLSKADLVRSSRASRLRGDLSISSVTGKGLSELVQRLWAILQKTEHDSRTSHSLRAET